MKSNAIETAIKTLKTDKAQIEAQLRLLQQALRPQAFVVKPQDESTAPAAQQPKRKPRAPKTAPTRKGDGQKTVEHMQVLSIMNGAMKLADIAQRSGLPQKRVRALLSDLVDDGQVIQHGAKRGLRFLARGVEFNPQVEG